MEREKRKTESVDICRYIYSEAVYFLRKKSERK